MEITIPPRDHGPSTFRYAWDENGEVTQMTRVREDQPSPLVTPRPIPGRQTIQWPFQSIVTETEIASPTTTTHFHHHHHYHHRRATTATTWRPWLQRRRDSDGHSIARNLVPDYVVNYLRGETPETVSKRKYIHYGVGKEGKRPLPGSSHRHLQSRAAEFGGFYDSESSEGRGSGDSGGDQERLGFGNEKRRGGDGRALRNTLLVGWRAGVAFNTLVGFVILIVGFICLILAISKASLLGGGGGRLAVFTGSCAAATRIDWGLHAVVNVFCVVLLAGAHYVFQVLSSPTREEVDEAHRKWQWLDIGVPSFRNLKFIGRVRVVLAVVVMGAAVVTQIMYNAVIFTSQTAPDFKAAVVTDAFTRGASFSNATENNNGGLSRLEILSLQRQASSDGMANLTRSDCFIQLDRTLESDLSAILLVSNINSPSSLLQTAAGPRTSPFSSIVSDQSTIRYCLSAPLIQPKTCEVNLNASLLGVVALLNSFALVAGASILFKHHSRFSPLCTLGDAINSFLREPDTATQQSGSLLSKKQDVLTGRWGAGINEPAKYYIPTHHYWIKSVSFTNLTTFVAVWTVIASLVIVALAISVCHDPAHLLTSFPSTLLGAKSLVMFPGGIPPAGAAIITALPQLGLVLLYLTTNSILTSYHLSHECSLFAVSPRPLRLSSPFPQGLQTSSLFLTLPRPLSWLLIFGFIALGFLLSQSFVLVSVTTGDMTANAVGLSGVGLLALLSLLLILLLLVLGLGLRKAPPAGLQGWELKGNPMVLEGGSCSAVVAARCHYHQFFVPGGNGTRDGTTISGEERRREQSIWKQELIWGVIKPGVGMEVGLCGFGRGEAQDGVGRLGVGRCYA
ncbi:hypothetical protein QC764_201670 [Podospora pseudoanserina]|uniref:DUF6536 domain-containing protein n=1 Tax=Podospora pseudoanserina TaxID=2609844 RepID=A0ABR0IFH9_9PEZI|nr:hypothetical protein QC764_201670 [Podospora pseudoanserina]